MFKKLKQKISEEQTSGRGSPGGGASGFLQRSSALPPSIHRNRTSLTDDNISTPNREIIHKQNTSNNESETSSVEVKIDKKPKRHLQEEFAASLEQKDQIISALQTQVLLLKQQLYSNEINIELPNPNVQTQSEVQSPVKNQNTENTLQSAGPVGNENADKTIETLTQKLKHQENLLHQCKERIKSQKECLAQLTSEKEALQEQLYERLQELKKIKDCHMVENTKLITQLRESKSLIEQLEQDKGMVIAETKRQIHETLELKEEEIARLHIHMKQVVLQSEELKKQKENSEKAAFEQLEKALSAAQLAEESHRKVQAEMDEKIKAVEKANEEKCVILQQELTRVKQEVRILELESSPPKCPQNDKSQLEDMVVQIESDKNEDSKVIGTMTEKHRKEIEYVKQQEQQHWREQLDIFTQQQQSEMEKLRKHCEEETAKLLKEKEAIFHAHIEEMNEIFLEKLNVKQTELEALSSELSDALNTCQNLEQYISKLKKDADKTKVEFESKLDQQRNIHKEQVEAIFKEQEVTEKSFKEEIIQLKQLLEAKEKREKELEQKKMKETLGKAESQCKRMSAELDFLCQLRDDNASIYENKFKNLQNKLEVIKHKKSKLEELVLKTETELNEVKTELDFQTSQVSDLTCELEEEKRKNIQNISSLTEKYESQLRNLGEEISQLKSHCTGKESEIGQIRHFTKQQIEKYRQLLSTKEEEISAFRDEYELKLKQQETQAEEAIEKATKMKEEFKQKFSEQEAKLKKEIEGNQLEFCQKEKQFTSKMLAMAHTSSLGINDAVSKLEMNQKKQLKSMDEAHKQEVDEVLHLWEKKPNQQAEELWGKQEIRLQEKEQEIRDLKEKLTTFAEKEGNNAEITWLKDKDTKKDKTIHELQQQLQQTLAQVNFLKEKEIDFKKQLVKLETDLNFSLKEKLTVQEQLNEIKITEEKKTYDLLELGDKLKMTDVELHALKMSHLKEQENYKTKLEGERNEFQQKQAEFENFKRDTIRQLADYQQKAETLLKIKVGELIEQCNENISSIIVKIAYCQQQTIKIKEGIVIKIKQIPDLEFQLKQLTGSHITLNSSLQESKKHLEEKEHLIMSMKADMEKLLTEKELLRKESYLQQQTATEKESCITELKKELSEHSNIVTSMREEINEKNAEITDLNNIISELNLRLEKTISEKETATMLNKQHKKNQLQLLNEMEVLSSKVESLTEDKVTALKQVDHWMNKMSEWKKKAQLRFTQNYNTIKELQSKIELINNQVSEKEKELNRKKEEHDKQTEQLEHLKSLMEQKQIRKEKQESDLIAEIKIHSARIAELEEHIARKTMENDSLMKECKKYREQNSEQKEMAQQLQQAQGAIVDKDDKLKEMEQKVLTFEKKMQVMEIDLEEKSKEFEGKKLALLKTKEEELKALEEMIISETTSKIADLEKKAEHKITSIKRQLTTQMEEKQQQNKLQKKLQEKEKKIMSLDLEKELIQKAETINVSAEQDKVHALENMQQMYDLKIDILRKDLLDKERLLEKYNEETNRCNISKMENQDQQELLKRAEEDKNKIENLQRELEEEIKKQASLLEQHTKCKSELTNIKVELKNKEVNQQNMEIALKDLEKKLQEKEEERQSLQQKMHHFGEDFMKERQHMIEVKNRITEYDKKLNRLQNQVDERSGLIKILEGNIEEKTKSVFELQKMVDKMQLQQKDLQTTLKHAEQEKQEQHRNLIKLQNDLRTLRKEHQQELEIMKKESREEMEQKIKYEQEDIELKHNSTLKQLMREFNTQLAQKDQELEMALKETISKAQEVESELIESHQTETVQLHKKISEKDDDLQRVVKKYEEILEAREEEMTKKVNKLEEHLVQLEDNKKRLAHEESWNGDEDKIAELQVQLAEKTILVNDSKLKEQEFREQIHTLQDKLKNYEKAVYVTTVKTPYRDGNLCHSDVSVFGEPTEFEYLRKVIFEYMMGHETKTMAKVITSVLKFPPDQTQKILEQENARTLVRIDKKFWSSALVLIFILENFVTDYTTLKSDHILKLAL
ncbi:golgin subfamily A member 4 isoform X4 [Thamnophis elegans]|uniref:golgin subfamily A member 4 isoform X4 n=1 Tax=Thamnophis elegans TaxID=35005 RepID=UPI001377DD18|nr:golgin subfamily A member 4 isoform X4 [Thamnophis elegans]